jgi:hypothetical protein
VVCVNPLNLLIIATVSSRNKTGETLGVAFYLGPQI